MANWNGHFILTVFGDFYPALNGDFRPPLTEPKFCKNYPLFSIIFKKQALFWERCKIKRAADLDRSQRQMKALHQAAIIMKIALRFRKAIFGAPSGTRTQDPLIKSQLLSQMANTNGVIITPHEDHLPSETADKFLSHES